MDMLPIARLYERDIDLLIVEELSISGKFLHWYLSSIDLVESCPSLVGVWHSVSLPGYGESDIVVVFDDGNGERTGLLIENKIDAPEMARQGGRYQQRGQLGIERGDWLRYHTCMMAPQRYLAACYSPEKYDCSLSYEAISGYFAEGDCARDQYRSQLMLNAVDQQRRGYVQIEHKQLSDYIRQYIQYAKEAYPDLQVQDCRPRPAENDWVEFYPFGQNAAVRVVHQNAAGWIKVFIAGDHAGESRFQQYFEGVDIEEQRVVVSLTKSGTMSLAVAVPPVDGKAVVFSEVKDDVACALRRLITVSGLLKQSHSMG